MEPLRRVEPAGMAPRSRSLASAAIDLLPLAILAGAAAIRSVRLPFLLVLVLGFVLARRTAPSRSAGWAAAIPVAVSLTWGLVPLPPTATDGSTCASPLAPFSTWRIAETLLTLASVALLVPLVGGGGGELGLRRPSRRVRFVAVGSFVVLGPLGLLLGPPLAAPFFGSIGLSLGDPAAILPATAFAVANGTMEEVAYRGCLQAWTRRSCGAAIAIAGQALVFGLAHATGPDVGGVPVLLFAAMAGGGLLAGAIVEGTGSLAIPIAAHIGLDIPLYYGNACRVA
jgi:membrane protease YdiL (CAAX protease family)